MCNVDISLRYLYVAWHTPMNLSGSVKISLNILMGNEISKEYSNGTGTLDLAELFIPRVKHAHLKQIQNSLCNRPRKAISNVYNL